MERAPRASSGARWGARAGLALALMAPAGCLDAGPIPLGRHLLAGRDQDTVALVAGPPGAPHRILLSRPQLRDGFQLDSEEQISTIDDAGPGARESLEPRVLLDHALDSGRVTIACGVGCGFAVDASGRLYLPRVNAMPDPAKPGYVDTQYEVVRVDPATGAQQIFDGATQMRQSASGTRRAFSLDDAPNSWLVEAADGTSARLTATALDFVGDDLFFVGDDHQLSVSRDGGGGAVALAPAEVLDFRTFETARGPLLVLLRPGDVAGDATTSTAGRSRVASLFDPLTQLETTLPAPSATTSTFAPSPSGRYLFGEGVEFPPDPGAPPVVTRTLFDRDSGQQGTQRSRETTSFREQPSWRPGREELWFVDGGGLWRWPAGGTPMNVDPTPMPYGSAGYVWKSAALLGDTAPTFTPDGRFRLIVAPSGDAKAATSLQSADDATAPPLLLNPSGTGLSWIWPLPDGRLLVEAWVTDRTRNDVYVIDPDARTSRALSSTGNVVAVGRGRFLALLHWAPQNASGDLTLVDYATGRATLVAENVHSVAVDAATDPADALGAGTRVVYLVRNRIASPYDGCWAVELP